MHQPGGLTKNEQRAGTNADYERPDGFHDGERYLYNYRVWRAGEAIEPSPRRAAAGRTEQSARTGRAFVRAATAPFLCLCGAKTRFCLLVSAFELPQARQTGGTWSVDLGLVELVPLAGVLSLCSQIV